MSFVDWHKYLAASPAHVHDNTRLDLVRYYWHEVCTVRNDPFTAPAFLDSIHRRYLQDTQASVPERIPAQR